MSNEKLYVVAERAAREKDEALLARTVEEMGPRGYLWGLLESRARACSQRGEHEVAFRLLRASCEGPSPSLFAWNDVAHELAKLPPDARPVLTVAKLLLERALAQGPMNVLIFHNVACAAVAMGLRDLAFDAIRGAAKHGYAKMDAIRTDAGLAPIAADPRFMAAVDTPMTATVEDLEALVLSLPLSDEMHIVHRAVFGMTFYFDGPIATSAARIGALLDAYLADIPPGTLAYYGPGIFKPLSKAMMTRQRKRLAAFPEGRFLTMTLCATAGDAGEFELAAEGDGADQTASATVAFPLEEARDPDGLYERFVRYASLAECACAHAGFDVRNRESVVYEGIDWDRAALRKRFLGFEGRNRWWAPGRAPPAHWLVWLGTDLVAALGGTSLASTVGEAEMNELPTGLAIRAARVPPIAPVGQPTDVGSLPNVARALFPRSIAARGAEDVARLARWTDVASTAWDNAGPAFERRPSTLGVGVTPTDKPKVRKRRSFFDV